MAAANKNNLEELIVEYQPKLKSFIRKRVARVEDAEDILQEVFYQLVKTVEAAMNPIEEVSGWLYRVARNMLANKRAKKHEYEMPSYPDDSGDDVIMSELSEVLFGEDSSSPEMVYLRSLVWQELEKALAELPGEQREIFEQTELEGIPVKEISEATGVPVNTLLSRKHYAVVHLRKRLKQLYGDIVGL
jgi:RNA polymerase sigma factor (sigma-70 family)